MPVENKIRTLLNAGKPTLGTRLLGCWPNQVETLGHAGTFDYVEFGGEYSPYTLHDLENFCRAAELSNLGTMIKVDQDTQALAAQRAIGAGFSSILFASSRTPEKAQTCIRSVRPETPEAGGTNGGGVSRNTELSSHRLDDREKTGSRPAR